MIRSFALLLLGASLLACDGNVDGDETPAEAPVVNTRLTLRIDDRAIDLGTPTGTRFAQADGSSYISLNAREARQGGDYIRSASALLAEPLKAGTFDCTPNDEGVVDTGTSFTPGDFFGFSAKLTDCSITVQYISSDRVVGTFTVKGHAPEESSLAGTASTATGEFDVPLVASKL